MMRYYIKTMSYHDRMRDAPEQPRFEPEIIPPDAAGPRPGADRDGVFVFIDERGGARRMRVGKPGPFSFILAFMIAGLALAGILLLAFSVLVVLVPVIAIAAAALIAYVYLCGTWRRVQNRQPR
jgi:hypothetical protein